MTLNKIFADPGLYFLLLFNLYFIYEFQLQPENYAGIVWIFWCQSVLIGLFNFLELLTLKNVRADVVSVNSEPVNPNQGQGCLALFFLLHFGGFHVGYLIFIAIKVGFRHINLTFFLVSLALLFVNQIFTFIRHKKMAEENKLNTSFLFFAPYLRVVPMHLMFLIPAFFGVSPGIVFLILKTVMDLAGYLLTQKFRMKTQAVAGSF